MIATIIIAGLTFVGITLSILFFPRITIKNIKIDTYWIIAIIGALLLVVTTLCPIGEIGTSWTSQTSVNPIGHKVVTTSKRAPMIAMIQ